MASQAGHEAKTSESSTSAPRERVGGAPQFGGRRDTAPLRRMQQSLGNRAMAQWLAPERQAIDAARRSVSARPLDTTIREAMEAQLGEDLASVRVHTDEAACRAVSARAYTVGEHIVFNAGAYAPQQAAGRALLAHELTHVIQQRGGQGGNTHQQLEGEADRVARTNAAGMMPVRIQGKSHVGIARQAEPLTSEAERIKPADVEDGLQEMRVDGIPVIRYAKPEKSDVISQAAQVGDGAPVVRSIVNAQNFTVAVQLSGKTIFVGIRRQDTTTALLDQKGIAQLRASGYRVVLTHNETIPTSVGENLIKTTPSADFQPPPQAPPRPPRLAPPAKRPQAAPKPQQANLPPLPAPLEPLPAPLDPLPAPQQQPNEANVKPEAPQPTQTPPVTAPTSDTRENTRLQQDSGEATRTPAVPNSDTSPPSSNAAVAAVLKDIQAELTEVDPLVVKLAADVPLHPDDHALNEVLGYEARLKADEKFLNDLELQSDGLDEQTRNEIHTAAVRIRVLQNLLAPALATAVKWHNDHPAGKSLGMQHEETGTELAGTGLKQFDKGGLHYIAGGAAFVGAFGVAFLDEAEKAISFGFHDTATAVSQAYTRGDISWNEGNRILLSAAGRALLIAAVTRGAGAATSRLGGLTARAIGITGQGSRLVVGGAISGGLTGAVALGTQSALTSGLEGSFTNPAAKAIWDQGKPTGKDWALAIPVGIVLGALGGAASAAKKPGTVPPNTGTNESTLATSGGTPGAGAKPIYWEVRQLGKTADGLDRFIARHASGEYVELVVDPGNKTIRATRIATGETISFENGQISAKPRGLLSSGEPGTVSGTGEPLQTGRTAPSRNGSTAGRTTSPATAQPARVPPKALPATTTEPTVTTPVQEPSSGVGNEAPKQLEAQPTTPTSDAQPAKAAQAAIPDPKQVAALRDQRAALAAKLNRLTRLEQGEVVTRSDAVSALEDEIYANDARRTELEAKTNRTPREDLELRRAIGTINRLKAQLPQANLNLAQAEAEAATVQNQIDQVDEALAQYKNARPWRSLNLADADNATKGLYGELEATSRLQAEGVEPAGKTVRPDNILTPAEFEAATKAYKGQTGIDGIYKRTNPSGETDWWVGESKTTGSGAEAPTGKGSLDTTLAGDQLSDDWVRSNLAKSGLSAAEQREFEQALQAGKVRKFYAQTTSQGTRFYSVNNVVGDPKSVRLGAEITKF